MQSAASGNCTQQQAVLLSLARLASAVNLCKLCAACAPALVPQTLVNEGVKGLYKGISAPLATVAVFNAVLFASRGQMEVLLKHKDGEQRMFC